MGLLVEGDAAPGRLGQLHLVVRQVVHLYYVYMFFKGVNKVSRKFSQYLKEYIKVYSCV